MWLTLFFLVYCIINLSISLTNFGNEETLRQNIIDVIQGKLKFSKETLPIYEEELNDITPKNNSEYDFIVVGAGSAGAVLASRLSEIKDFTILLLEAGSEEYPFMDIPLMAPFLQLSDQVNWDYRTESSDKYCRGFTDSQCLWPRGKVTGGSSVLNYMTATRGNKGNYNEWASLTGDESWSFKNMLRYFKKSETFNVDNVEFNSELHNRGGPLHISISPFNSDFVGSYIEAGKELGYPEVDYNGEEQIGFSHMQSTVRGGERWSTNRAYLHPAKNRSNLFFSRNTLVNKILINEESKFAYGVKFTKFGETIVVNAKREVIVCAGAINSPQILMLSGIGPTEHLSDLGINVIKDAPVGKNLMDHAIYGHVFKTNVSLNPVDENLLDPKNSNIKDYIMQRNGMLTLGAGFEALSFVNVDDLEALSGTANIELIFAPNSGLKDPTLLRILGISQANQDLLAVEKINTVAWSLWCTVVQPKSRGILLLRSKDPNDKPKIYPNYYDDPEDIRVLVKGLRLAIEISKTKAFQKFDSQLVDIPVPCKDYVYDSDAYWECVVRTFTITVNHFSGTCKMGREDDPTAVVNPKLQVIGIKNLRVIDASIMPKIISGHTNVPTVAIAEKMSDIIKEDWGYKLENS